MSEIGEASERVIPIIEIQKIGDRKPHAREKQGKKGDQKNSPVAPLEPHKGQNVDIKV